MAPEARFRNTDIPRRDIYAASCVGCFGWNGLRRFSCGSSLTGGGSMKNWRSIPWYVYLAGTMGVGIITAIGFSIPRIGVAPTLTLIITVQLIVGVLMDHFGWLTTTRPMDLTRLLGIVILFIGTWIILR